MATKLARILGLAVVAALVAIGAGCGGDDDSGGGGPLGAATTAAEPSATTETSEGSGGALPGLGSDECNKLARLGAEFSQAMTGAANSKDVEEQVRLFEDFADQTPEDVRDDFQVLAEEYSKIAQALSDANFQSGEQPDPEAVQKFQEAMQSVDQKRLDEATTNIEQWMKENCPNQ